MSDHARSDRADSRERRKRSRSPYAGENGHSHRERSPRYSRERSPRRDRDERSDRERRRDSRERSPRRDSRDRDDDRSERRRERKKRSGWDQGPDPAAPAAAPSGIPMMPPAAVPSIPGFGALAPQPTASAGYIHPSRAMQLGHLTGSAAPPPMPSMPTHSAPAAPLISGPGGGPINPALASIMGNLQNILPGLMQNVGASAATANPATRQARRLYVGNLPMPISDAELRIFMSEAYKRANPGHTPGEPVISVYLNMEKKFGFVEFRTPEEATTGLALDGIQMRGQVLKVRRPSDYVPPPGAAPAPMSAYNTAPGVISTQVPDGPNKVFAGGLPYTLTENEIKELLGTFGTLRAFHLVKDRDTNTSKGYCFFEYADPNVTDGAIAGLNNIKIGDKTLTVRRAVPKNDLGAAGGSAMLNSAAGGTNLAQIGALAALRAGVINPNLLQTATRAAATRVLVLTNMVTVEELLDDKEYSEILEDIQTELSKHGEVRAVVIPRPGTVGETVPGLGKVFVEFGNEEAAARARADVEGRQFGGRPVGAEYMEPAKFANREF